MTSYRLDKGGLIDRESALRFTFDGPQVPVTTSPAPAGLFLCRRHETARREHRVRGISRRHPAAVR